MEACRLFSERASGHSMLFRPDGHAIPPRPPLPPGQTAVGSGGAVRLWPSRYRTPTPFLWVVSGQIVGRDRQQWLSPSPPLVSRRCVGGPLSKPSLDRLAPSYSIVIPHLFVCRGTEKRRWASEPVECAKTIVSRISFFPGSRSPMGRTLLKRQKGGRPPIDHNIRESVRNR